MSPIGRAMAELLAQARPQAAATPPNAQMQQNPAESVAEELPTPPASATVPTSRPAGEIAVQPPL